MKQNHIETKTNSDASLPDMAMSLNATALQQKDTGRYTEAEDNYTKALEIYIELVKRNQDNYHSNIIDVLKNLIEVKEKMSKIDKSEELKRIVKKEINVLFTRIDSLTFDKGNKNRFDEIESYYTNIEYIQEKLDMKRTVLSDYLWFLLEQGKDSVATEKFAKILAKIRKLAETNPDTYLPDLAFTLNGWGLHQKNTECYTEAESAFNEAIEIRRKLAESNPGTYLSLLAQSLNNLATLQKDTGRNTEAEKNNAEVREIHRKLDLKNIPEELRTAELCLMAVRSYGRKLEYVPEELKTTELFLEAVKSDGMALEHIPEELKTVELCLEAVKQYWEAIKYVPEHLKTTELCLEAIKSYDDDFTFASTFGYSDIFQYIPENSWTMELCLYAVKLDWNALRFVPEKFKTAELCLKAVKSNGSALEYVPKELKTAELCDEALKTSRG